MKKISAILSILIVLIVGAYGQNLKHEFEINSISVEGETYPIEVVLPDEYDSTLRYPVLYVTDWWFYSHYDLHVHKLLSEYNLIDPIIIVGIGTIGDRTDWSMERRRDLTPTHLIDENRSDSSEAGSRGITGGAENFLMFIKSELIPDIESRYLTDTLNRGFVGYSFGGLFGAFILSTEPQLFQHYLLGSPTMKYDDFIVMDELMETTPEKLNSVKSIFISVGEEELGDDLKGFADLRDFILAVDLAYLNFESTIIYGEGHVSAIPQTLIKGLKFLYGSK
jgi:predicted alpha/beta superfamily hydrolase